MEKYKEIDISDYVNNRGITYENNQEEGNLTYRVQSFPAEVLLSKDKYYLNNTPFKIMYSDRGDNIELSNTHLLLPSQQAKKIHFIGVSSNGDFFEDIKFLHRGKLIHTERLFFSDFTSKIPLFQNTCFLNLDYIHSSLGKDTTVKSSIWHYCMDFKKSIEFDEIFLKENISMHIFAITIER